MLSAQGLVDPPSAPAGPDEVLQCIRRMGVLQIDTIHVVARSPYLVLWSRVGQYDPAVLDGLLAQAKLFEYWAHEACFIPIERFPVFRRFMLDRRRRHDCAVDVEAEPRTGREARRTSNQFKWIDANPEAAERMFAHVRERGETRSSDFEREDGQSGSWWNWKHEKHALEYLHSMGHLMIARRERFQRVYSLLERVLPDWSDHRVPTHEEAMSTLVEESVRCLGAAPLGFIGDYHRLPKTEVRRLVERLCEAGRLVPVTIEGIKEFAVVHSDDLELAHRAMAGEVVPSRTVLLSPFDPVVWDRARARALFDFDYTIECYTPGPKRKYGYFVLPILHRDRLIGRLDAKAHRSEKVFEVKCLYFEPGVQADDEVVDGVAGTIRDCARWHGTPKVRVAKTVPSGFARKIQGCANRS